MQSEMTLPNDDGTHLGKKHEKYNKLVQKALTNNKQSDEKTFTAVENNDMDNLLKIDIACHHKNIDYVLSVLKSGDMLYISRAIKQSPWLADDQYEQIVNPEYLNNNIFPQITAKARIKLLKHIRQHLKTERRVEEFYNNEITPSIAQKWLSRCSVPFIISKIDEHLYNFTNLEYKRLCEKSIEIFEASMKNSMGGSQKLKVASFLVREHADKYLNVFESRRRYSRPCFGPKCTELIMKHAPDRVKKNFLEYIYHIDVPTFVTYIKSEDIAGFLYDLTNDENDETRHNFRYVFTFKIIKHFVKRMPKSEQFAFVKKVFLNKDILQIKDESLMRGTEMYAIKHICTTVCADTPSYHWYVFAPFEVAFSEIKKLMFAEVNINEKYSMILVLLKCANGDTKNTLSLLTFYYKNPLKDDIGRKKYFVSDLLSQTEIFLNDEETWNSYINIFKNMDMFKENYNQKEIEVSILYHILHDKEVSETITKDFAFNTLKSYRSKLNNNDQNKVFEYLYKYIMKKVESHLIQTEEQFNQLVQLHHNLLDLLKDWDKSITDFPQILDKIKNLTRLKNENNWKISLSGLYTKEKSWKRYMFEDSLTLHPSQEVCVNALKHDPGLLLRYKDNVEVLCRDDSVTLEQFLKKIRIYWPDSLADSFTKYYLDRLNVLGGHKALTRGLFTLLLTKPASEIFKKYAPKESKIDWDNIDELTLSLQRCIAKKMHITRPQPSADSVLLYAKGDFLQYAIPSLRAIYYNMSHVQSEQDIPKLLDAPVSLQKHGLRFAFAKLKHEELKGHLARIWKTTKNITIRSVTFVLLFDLMCKENDEKKAIELWEILDVFIANLSFEEDKKIYEKLREVERVPSVVRAKFLMKSYNFLEKLIPNVKIERESYEYAIEQLAKYTREVMETINPDFVADLIEQFITEKFLDGEVRYLDQGMLKVVSSYLLCAKDEDTQSKKCEKILLPLVKRSLNQWNETCNENYYIRNHFQSLLNCFAEDLREYVFEKKMIVPFKMYSNIKKELDTNLDIPQNYVMLSMWKLVTKLTELISDIDQRDNWDEMCSQIIPSYGKFCVDVLKEDVKSYFTCIYIVYSKVLRMAVRDILPDTVSVQIYEKMIGDTEFIQAFLVTVKLLADMPYYWPNELEEWKKRENEIRNTIRDHPSVEVKMHYYGAFQNEADNVDVVLY